MLRIPHLARAVAGALLLPQLGWAAQLPLATYPPGSASRQPAPNVIVTVDDSGSMEDSGIASLQTALRATFTSGNIADDQIRLAFQSMNMCSGIPNSNAICNGRNGMKILRGQDSDAASASSRGAFFRFIDGLQHPGNTPSHSVVRSAGAYLMQTGLGRDDPWAKEPGVTQNPILACRRAYHIFMTDGGWNSEYNGGSWLRYAGGPGNPVPVPSYHAYGNADGSNKILPDGTNYNTSNPQTRIYQDAWGGVAISPASNNNTTPTLADLAFYYWATDLRSDIPNTVKPLVRQATDETFRASSGSNSQTLEPYWNPKNDPATWQHLTTYSIGFNAAAAWGPRSNGKGRVNGVEVPNPLFSNGGMYGADFANTIAGSRAWSDEIANGATLDTRPEGLWHMAINSRGKFIPATSSQALVDAFKEILGQIIADTSQTITSFTSASQSVKGKSTEEFFSGYKAADWSGYIKSNSLAQGSGSKSPNPAWGTRAGQPPEHISSADKLDALTPTNGNLPNRLILSTNDTSNTGVSFEWQASGSRLSLAQNALLQRSDGPSVGQDRLNFIRGDRSKEGKPLRQRGSRQGDIVNSSIWYVAKPVSNYSLNGYSVFAMANNDRLPMLYVGGNDGMLHGFSALDGSEKIAYVPKGVIKNLADLADPNYQHAYFVDGAAFTGDINLNALTNPSTPNWRTLLVGALGLGGKGYFVLDVSQPGSTASNGIASNFSAANASNLVMLDRTLHATLPTLGDDADIGHITAEPVVDDNNPYKTNQITRMNNGRWAVVMGNGYNSSNERPVLLVQYLDGDKALKTIPAVNIGDSEAVGNGLSAPRLLDINGDGTPDVVYAGDLRGNLWKFDITDTDPSKWDVAFGKRPLYTAVRTLNNASSRQAITAAPLLKANDRGIGGLMVAFGTGRDLTEADRTDTSTQTIYTVWDNSRYKLSGNQVSLDTSAATPSAAGTGVANLVEQKLTSSTALDGSGASSTRKFWTLTQNNVNYVGAGAKKGWYFHLPVAGERILAPMAFYDSSNNMEVISEVPGTGGNVAEESCDPVSSAPQKYRTFLNIMDGKKPGVQILDLNGDGYYNALDQGVSRMTASVTESSTRTGTTEIRSGADGTTDVLAPMPEQPVRPSWRQLQ